MCVEAWSHMFLNPVNVGARYNVVCVCVCCATNAKELGGIQTCTIVLPTIVFTHLVSSTNTFL
jgi:hypothetical protein